MRVWNAIVFIVTVGGLYFLFDFSLEASMIIALLALIAGLLLARKEE